MPKYTKYDLMEMWKRPVERQYNIAILRMLEAISDTDGDITLSFSGGKDSTLMLDMFCELWAGIPQYKDRPVRVAFANTTNETHTMLKFIRDIIPYMENKYHVKIDFTELRPSKGMTWVRFVREVGIPLISKDQAQAISKVRTAMSRTGCDYDTVLKLFKQDDACVAELFDIGFTASEVLSVTGFVSRTRKYGRRFRISKKWLPMLCSPVPITEKCCEVVKESALHKFTGNCMTGEQAQESARREMNYLVTGCNFKTARGVYTSKPFGPMTSDGILFALKYRNTPLCSDYGDIIQDDTGHYRCSKLQRTGCALCGFGCQYDTDRFLRIQEIEPAKVKFAFKSVEQGGAGYGEAISYMNEYCGTKVLIPTT